MVVKNIRSVHAILSVGIDSILAVASSNISGIVRAVICNLASADDLLQEIQEPQDPDYRIKGARPLGQLRRGTDRVLYRKDQALRAPDRPVRRHHRRIQQGVQCDHRAGKPVPALGQDRQRSATVW